EQAFHPDSAPPTQEDAADAGGDTGPPEDEGPRAALSQADREADDEPEQPSQNHPQSHKMSYSLADALPVGPGRGAPSAGGVLRRKFVRPKRIGRGGTKMARNILPGREETQGVVCPQDQIPKFASALFLVEVSENQVGHRQRRKGLRLFQEQGDFVSRIE